MRQTRVLKNSFKFKKFIQNVQIPHTKANKYCLRANFSVGKLFLERIKLYAREHMKATNKKAPISPLCEVD